MPPINPPARERRDGPIPPGAARVLLTGFGLFGGYETTNPSWEAASVLHDNVLPSHEAGARSIHITAVKVPVVYSTVLSAVPPFHASPPQITLPVSNGADGRLPPPPQGGYDFIFHVGVGHSGALAVEQLAHKTGYVRKDVDGELAPPIHAQNHPSDQKVLSKNPTVDRGFGKGYREFADELETSIDVNGLVAHLKQRGHKHVRLSLDPGRYLCDFIYYCSLAESHRSRPAGNPAARTKVLFMHVPPIGDPCPLEEMSDAIEEVIRWVCAATTSSLTT